MLTVLSASFGLGSPSPAAADHTPIGYSPPLHDMTLELQLKFLSLFTESLFVINPEVGKHSSFFNKEWAEILHGLLRVNMPHYGRVNTALNVRCRFSHRSSLAGVRFMSGEMRIGRIIRPHFFGIVDVSLK